MKRKLVSFLSIVVILLSMVSVTACSSKDKIFFLKTSEGTVYYGDSEKQVEKVLGEGEKFTAVIPQTHYKNATGETIARIYFRDGKATSLEVPEPGISTYQGIHVGQQKEEVLSKFEHWAQPTDRVYSVAFFEGKEVPLEGEYLAWKSDMRFIFVFDRHDKLIQYSFYDQEYSVNLK